MKTKPRGFLSRSNFKFPCVLIVLGDKQSVWPNSGKKIEKIGGMSEESMQNLGKRIILGNESHTLYPIGFLASIL